MKKNTDKFLQWGGLKNVPGNMFLRSFRSRLKALEPLKIKRIKNAMLYAAKNGGIHTISERIQRRI